MNDCAVAVDTEGASGGSLGDVRPRWSGLGLTLGGDLLMAGGGPTCIGTVRGA